MKKHPKVANGKLTEEQAFAEFLKTFDSPDDPDGKVNKMGTVFLCMCLYAVFTQHRIVV